MVLTYLAGGSPFIVQCFIVQGNYWYHFCNVVSMMRYLK